MYITNNSLKKDCCASDKIHYLEQADTHMDTCDELA
jgi:hypothetical protein